MKKSQVMYVEKMKIYLSFLDTCKNKNYSENEVTHEHHILPKCIYGKTKDTINLSVEDHITAHILLSECFEENTYERNANLKSARVLNKNSIKDKNLLKLINKSYEGESNPFFGKKHSKDITEMLAQKAKHQCKGISYQERYGSKAEKERQKRSEGVKKYWENIDANSKTERAKKIASALIGRVGEKNAMSKKVEIDGIQYESLSLARKALNTTNYSLKKNKTFKYI